MSVRSMTGFGRAFYEQNGFSFEVMIKGVNSRFSEFNFKLPQVISSQEQSLRAILQKKISRGKVTLTVNGNFEVFKNTKLHCDTSAVKHYLSICHSLGLPTTGPSGVNAKWEALRQPGVLVFNGTEQISPRGKKLLDRMLKECLDSFLEFKNEEGRKIRKELLAYSRRVWSLCKKMAIKSQTVKKDMDLQIRQLAGRYAQNSDQLRDRIGFEVATLLDRLDITEECTRLNFHLGEFRKSLAPNAGNAIGRKLDFLLQEMHREVNTIGSKGRDTELSRWVVEAKDYLERMREQVQNVE